MPIVVAKGYCLSDKAAILAEIDAIKQAAPPFRAAIGESSRLRYFMTNCGKYGWIGTEGYTMINPLTEQRWPPVPPTIGQIMVKIGKHFYPNFRLETVLMNFYTNDLNSPTRPVLGFHQDTSERNREAPIISISFGAGSFLIGGKVDDKGQLTTDEITKLNRTNTTKMDLGDGDLLVMHGAERLCFHAADEIYTPERINLTGRMVDPDDVADKPLIIAMMGMERTEKLSDPIKTRIDEALTYRRQIGRNKPSEILLSNEPGFSQKVISYIKSKRYPSLIVYDAGYEEIAGRANFHLGTAVAQKEMLTQADNLLVVTNGTEQRTTEAIAQFTALGKTPWIFNISDADNDSPSQNQPAPTNPPVNEPTKDVDPDRRQNGLGAIAVTNIKNSGKAGFSSTWHSSDWRRVYVGRGGTVGIQKSPLHNPWNIDATNTREKVIDYFRAYLWDIVKTADTNNATYAAMVKLCELITAKKNVELVCHCKPLACHGEIIYKAVVWMIENNKVPPPPATPPDGQLHVAMAGLNDLVGLTPRMELEISSLLINKHREWYLKLNGVPTRNPIIHIGNNPPSATGRGFDWLVQRFLKTNKYPNVVIHDPNAALPSELPTWTTSDQPLLGQAHYLFAIWDEEEAATGALIGQMGSRALVAYDRKPKVNVPNPLPKINDPQRYAKYGAAVPAGAYVAIVGSRKFKNSSWASNAITQLVNALPSDCTVVSGGADGADSFAENAAQTRGMQTLIHDARWVQRPPANKPSWKPTLYPPDRAVEDSNERSNAGTERNKVLVEECNCLFAFTYEDSSGSQDAISYAALKRKFIAVFKEEEKEVAPEKRVSSNLDLFYFDEDE